mmetsp:Transcript_45132/g.52867  ORF Transcript_45132/g.52867 Transcript_45132/m.52867 type:complete len:108 (+) Transcript_45132:24-347(+)
MMLSVTSIVSAFLLFLHVSCGQKDNSLRSKPKHNLQSETFFSGVYSDPNHPGCPRDIMVVGTHAVIIGVDGNPGCLLSTVRTPWTVYGTVSDDDIIVDFSSKVRLWF